MTEKFSNAEIGTELSRIKLSYGPVIKLLENGDAPSAAVAASRLITRLSRLMDTVKKKGEYNKAFIEALIANRMPAFKNDKETLASLSEKALDTDRVSDPAKLKETVHRLENHIHVFSAQTKALFPRESDLLKRVKTFVKEYGRVALIVGLPLLVLVGGISIFKRQQLRRHSLKAVYFDDRNLGKPIKTRLDSSIDFSWGYGAPFVGGKTDGFSVRWSGYVKVDVAGTYVFQTEADDGVRLWVADQKIIDDWRSHLPEKHEGEISLERGYQALVLDYYEDNANAEVHLRWKMKGEERFRVVEPSSLVSEKRFVPQP